MTNSTVDIKNLYKLLSENKIDVQGPSNKLSDRIADHTGAISRVVQRGDWDTHRRIVEREQLVEDLKTLANNQHTFRNVLTLIDLCSKQTTLNRHEVLDYLLNNRKRLEARVKLETTRQIFRLLEDDNKFFFDLC